LICFVNIILYDAVKRVKCAWPSKTYLYWKL